MTYRQCIKKAGINKTWSTSVKSFLAKPDVRSKSKRPRVLILDTRNLHTTIALCNVGVLRSQIWAPNDDLKEVKALTKAGVHAPHKSMEEYLRRARGNIPVFWYDGMTPITGGAKGWYPGVAVDTYLQRGLGGDNCLIGVTTSTHNKKGNIGGNSQQELLRIQMEAIFSGNGYSFNQKYLDNYKKGLCFGMWELKRTNHKRKREMISMPDGTWVGFPKGYDTSHLV
jgi:hypothetical protein